MSGNDINPVNYGVAVYAAVAKSCNTTFPICYHISQTNKCKSVKKFDGNALQQNLVTMNVLPGLLKLSENAVKCNKDLIFEPTVYIANVC